jgi:hypothetical protein
VNPVPACSSSGCEAMAVATPTITPHTGGVSQVREGHGRVTSRISRCTLAKAQTTDGDSGLLQDGEGWKPQSIHQSILVVGTIDYRPLASEVLMATATEGACLEPPGAIAFEGVLGWRASAKPLLPTLIASGPARAYGRMTSAHDQAEPTEQIGVPLTKLHRSCVEESKRLQFAIWRTMRKPPAAKHVAKVRPRKST